MCAENVLGIIIIIIPGQNKKKQNHHNDINITSQILLKQVLNDNAKSITRV